MEQALDFGIPGLDMVPNDHVCAIYMGTAERDAMLIPYLRAGLRSGDKCVCVVDGDTDEVRAGVSNGVDVDAALHSGQLEMLSSPAAYRGREPGQFKTEDMIGFWEDT